MQVYGCGCVAVWLYDKGPEPEVIDLCGLDVAVFFRLMQLGECSSGCGNAYVACRM
jgi:hypothetical protein